MKHLLLSYRVRGRISTDKFIYLVKMLPVAPPRCVTGWKEVFVEEGGDPCCSEVWLHGHCWICRRGQGMDNGEKRREFSIWKCLNWNLCNSDCDQIHFWMSRYNSLKLHLQQACRCTYYYHFKRWYYQCSYVKKLANCNVVEPLAAKQRGISLRSWCRAKQIKNQREYWTRKWT